MTFEQSFFTRNECYITGRSFRPSGVCLHSTGANNPKLSRYVPAWNVYHPGGRDIGPHKFVREKGGYRCAKCGGRQVCVHGFLGKRQDGSVGFVQTMPWDRPTWHCGGSANSTHIGFEICEDGLDDPVYFNACYAKAVEVVAYLCKRFAWNPLDPKVVTCHCDAHKLGWASNHGDVMHWFRRYRKTMDGFRKDVKAKMEDEDMTQEQFDSFMNNWLERKAKESPTWSAPYLDLAKEKGIMDGTRPHSPATREEVAVMVLNSMGEKPTQKPVAEPVERSTFYSDNGMLTVKVPAERFKIALVSKGKRDCGKDYCNAGFFAPFAEAGEKFTLPVGHTVCDYKGEGKWLDFYTHERGEFNGDKFRFDSGSFKYKNHLYGKEQYTLVVKNGFASIEKLAHAPTDCDYAISGISLISKGKYMTLYDAKARQGWLGSELVSGFHIIAALKESDPKHIYIIGMKTYDKDMITGSEAYKRLQPLGYTDAIKLDGGGSYCLNWNGTTYATAGNRQICTVISF